MQNAQVMVDNNNGKDAETDPRSEATRRESEAPRKSADQIAPGKLAGMTLLTLGVVYGDIGTSPIYALRQCFSKTYGLPTTPANIFGILSLILWALVIVVSLKYVIFVLRADNHGEGGIFALLALLGPWRHLDRRRRRLLIMLGVFGAALLYGDMMITPAISVLSAIEGVEVADPHFQRYVVPLTIVILALLFLFQRRGTQRIGNVFGPMMLLWFSLIAALGVASIIRQPRILEAVNPLHAADFFIRNRAQGYLVLSAVILAITGSEALYADLGHFGRPPIRRAWFGLVLPALLLNYFGQGALLLSGAPAAQPFFQLAPQWMLYPLVAVAAAATIIASQATISGAFSLTHQAVQLGQWPWVQVQQTSAETQGQVYVPMVNWVLMVATIGLVLLFESSSNLSAAYGVAVNSTMAITTVLAFNVAIERGGWSKPAAYLLLGGFLAIDLAFLGANMTKIPDGGWFSIGAGLLFFLIMWTWRRGSMQLAAEMRHDAVPMDELLAEIGVQQPARVAGTAVFVTDRLENAPPVLRHHLLRTKTLHKQVILLTVLTEPIPKVKPADRLEVKRYEHGIWRLVAHYGYMQGPNIPSELKNLDVDELAVDLDDTTYYIGRQTLVPVAKDGSRWRRLMSWRDRLFAYMQRNSVDVSTFYHIPSENVIEIGLRVRL